MSWQTPSFLEIPMNAEVGSYQDEEDRPAEWQPDFVEEESAER